MLVLPTRQDAAHYSFEIELDSELFDFTFDWNDREERWYMTIGKPAIGALRAGTKLVYGTELNRAPNGPTGTLVLYDSSGTETLPGFADLGGRVELIYVSESEL